MKTSHQKVLVLLATLLFMIPANANDNTALAELLQRNTYPIALENGELKGPGATLILDSAADTQFVALGEEHYNFYIPDITTALFAALHERYGYQFLMTEQDPVMMELVSRPPVRGDQQKINALATEYPMGVTFNSEQELRMLAGLGRISTTSGDVIWGCDQGFGVTHTLDQLLQELDDEDTQAADAVRAFRQIAAEKEAVRDLSDGTFMFHQDAADFISLKARVNPPPGSRSEWLLDVLINSSQIYDYYENGNQGLLPGYYREQPVPRRTPERPVSCKVSRGGEAGTAAQGLDEVRHLAFVSGSEPDPAPHHRRLLRQCRPFQRPGIPLHPVRISSG